MSPLREYPDGSRVGDTCSAQQQSLDLTDEATAVATELERYSLRDLLAEATRLRELGHRRIISYSRKVFIPLTRLCRDSCGYCTFATTPGKVASPYLSPAQILEIAETGRRAGCQEALFTLGDKPKSRYEFSSRGAGCFGLHQHCRLSERDVRSRVAGNRPIAARQRRRHERCRDKAASRSQRVARTDAGKRI